jgi:hypothetical protein
MRRMARVGLIGLGLVIGGAWPTRNAADDRAPATVSGMPGDVDPRPGAFLPDGPPFPLPASALPMPALGLTVPVTMQLVIAAGEDVARWQPRLGSVQPNDAAPFRATGP